MGSSTSWGQLVTDGSAQYLDVVGSTDDHGFSSVLLTIEGAHVSVLAGRCQHDLSPDKAHHLGRALVRIVDQHHGPALGCPSVDVAQVLVGAFDDHGTPLVSVDLIDPATFDYGSRTVRLSPDEARRVGEQLIAEAESTGYQPHPFTAVARVTL